MLEDLARVSTGFSARAVEFFETLSTTQHVNHVRPQAPGTAGVRDANAMELVRGPFDTTPHTVDVRTMDDVYGWHNLPNIGLFVWPVPSYPLDRATAVAVAQPPDGRWLVDPLGVDRAMAGPMVVETSIDHRAEEANVPGPLRRRPLHDELDERRAAPSAQRPGAQWFDPDDPAVVVWIQDTPATELTSVPLDLLFVGDLSDWSLPTGQEVRLDPVLGRIAVSPTRAVNRVAVSWHYAFSGDVGAGPYPRRDANPPATTPIDFQIGVSATDAPVANTVVATFGEAVDAWNAFQAGKSARLGRIVVMDSHRYAEASDRRRADPGRSGQPADDPRRAVAAAGRPGSRHHRRPRSARRPAVPRRRRRGDRPGQRRPVRRAGHRRVAAAGDTHRHRSRPPATTASGASSCGRAPWCRRRAGSPCSRATTASPSRSQPDDLRAGGPRRRRCRRRGDREHHRQRHRRRGRRRARHHPDRSRAHRPRNGGRALPRGLRQHLRRHGHRRPPAVGLRAVQLRHARIGDAAALPLPAPARRSGRARPTPTSPPGSSRRT